MNYIQHLTGFFNKLSSDDRPNPTHVSLYIALFQQWNSNHFQNPISISRSCTMQMSKIGSQNTYHKCLNDLNCWGYLSYRPSRNPTKGSMVYLFSFDTSTCTDSIQASRNNDTSCIQVVHKFSRKSDTSCIQVLRSSKNNINNTNNKTNRERKKNAQNSNKNDQLFFSNDETIDPSKVSKKGKRKKVAPKKEKVFTAPSLEEALEFFKGQEYPDLEARKFFYHFQANGWKVGGKSPMKDWNAAAHNWMLNEKNFHTPSKTNNAVTLNTQKRYDIPL